jgi:hypothetical protein
MRQLTLRDSNAPSAKPLTCHHIWLFPVSLVICQLAWAGLPAAPAAAPLRAVAQAAAPRAAGPSAAGDASHQTWRGAAYVDLAADWTRWLLSIPLGVNPIAEAETGINCAVDQNGPVWLLAAPGGATDTRTCTCTMPSGKALMMPVASYIDDYPCPPAFGFQPPPDLSLEDFLRADAMSIMDGTTGSATLDDRPLRLARVTTGVFPFTAAGSLSALGDACLADLPQLAVMDALPLFIDPPSPGAHTLRVSSTNPFFGTTTGTLTLIVKK